MFSERKTRSHYKQHYFKELKYFEAYADKKPASVIKKEMKALQSFWGCYPFQYIRYGMYKKSCKLSVKEMKDYIPNFFAYYLLFPKSFKDYGVVTEDKELTYRVFDSYKIKHPVLLLHYKNKTFYDNRKNIITDAEANDIISKSNANKLFFKPNFGLGGQGIMVFNKKEKFMDDQGESLNANLIHERLKSGGDYILQEGLIQHEELNNIYPNAVNTFRIITKIKNGEAEILYAMLRMGQGGSQLDNGSKEGLVCKVNIDTGQFDDKGHSTFGRVVEMHPDTKFVFRGYCFPYWDEIKKEMLISTKKMDSIQYIGWDVAYTQDGPVIIEMNSGPGLEYLQDCHGGVRKGFDIDNPKTYWYSNRYAIRDL